MPGTLATCSYAGLNIRAASMSFSRGVTPSICTLACTPFDDLDLAPSTLRFDYGGVSVQFTDAAVMGAFVRKRQTAKGWKFLWSVQVMDRRWRWAYGNISGEYNRRTPQGEVDENNRKTPAELAGLLLSAMGEGGFDTSGMPQGVFPYAKWENQNPALCLAALCEYVGCEVVLNHLTNRVEIWQLGVGPGTQTGFGELHQKYRFTPRSTPGSIEVHCGPSVFQNKLRLRAVATNSSGVQDTLANTFSTVTLSQQALHFPGLSTDQHLALDQAWKEYRVTGQADSSLAVPQCQETITSTDQYLLEEFILDPAENDLSDYKRRLPYYVEGDFWAYADTPTGLSDKRCLMPSRLYPDRRLVKFQHPVIKLDSSGLIAEPTLYLTTAYQVKSVDGNLVHLVRSGSASGSGTLILRRPEIFAAYKSSYSGANSTGTTSTQSQAQAEADRYVSIFQQRYSSAQASELTYPGIIAGNLNGVVAQCRWSCGVNREPFTLACEHEELDVSAVPRTERRRREILRQIAEAMA
jgi:hypothetical protein